jgi:hypothetical protein
METNEGYTNIGNIGYDENGKCTVHGTTAILHHVTIPQAHTDGRKFGCINCAVEHFQSEGANVELFWPTGKDELTSVPLVAVRWPSTECGHLTVSTMDDLTDRPIEDYYPEEHAVEAEQWTSAEQQFEMHSIAEAEMRWDGNDFFISMIVLAPNAEEAK